MGLSKYLILSISEEFLKRNDNKKPIINKDDITFNVVGKNSISSFYLGYKLDNLYSFYLGHLTDNKFSYREIFYMPIYIGDY